MQAAVSGQYFLEEGASIRNKLKQHLVEVWSDFRQTIIFIQLKLNVVVPLV